MTPQKLLNSILILVAIMAVFTMILFVGKQGEQSGTIIKQREKIEELRKQIVASELTRAREADLRKIERKKDSLSIVNLIYLRKLDSASYIRSTRNLMKEYKKLTEDEIDAELIKAYRESLINP